MTLRVLAVEDSPTQAAKLLDALQTAGHEVREARSGDEALRVLAAESVDLVVSDVMMPGNVDGYALCQRIKAERPGVPVILLTSLSDPLDIIRGLEAGADNFLTKPYAPEHLNERIQVLMATRRDRDRSRVQTGVTVYFMGRHFTITSEREQILDLLVSTFEDAVRQNRELRQREEDLSRSRERLAGMYQMAVGLNSCTTEQEVIDTALDRAVSLPRVRAAWIFLGSKEEDLRLAGARNLPAGVAVPGALDGTCRCQQMLMAGELDTATRIIECERLKAVEHAPGGLHQHASVPLRCGGRCLGVMNLLGEGEGFFDEDDRTILYGIGNQIAFATERARMWTHLETLVEERTAALRQSEERYRTLVDAVSDGFFMTDERGVITFANPALAAMCGLAAASLLEGRALADFLPMSMRETVMEKLLSSASSASPSDLITAPLVRSDASEAIAEIRATSILSDGSLVGTRGVIRDVTERVRAQEALLLSSSILERIGNLVLVADREGLIRYASPSLETLLGYRPAEALGAGWWQLPWAEAEERERARQAFLDPSAEATTGQHELRARDGSTRWHLVEEFEGPDGLRIRVGHDITERKKMEEQYLQAQRMEAVGQLAGGIAHDFNNVLTAILTTADLILDDLPDASPFRADISTIQDAGQRAAAFTRQLLAFSRKQVLKVRVLDLNDVVQGITQMTRHLLGEDIEVTTHLASALGSVRVDPGQLEQVILNLVVNARDAMERGGQLIIETRNADVDTTYSQNHLGMTAGPYVLLTVSDTGIGMDDATVARVFEPFFTTKDVGKGTGLGLATVYGIVKQSGGYVWVYSEPGHGTTFKIYLPRVDEPATPVAPPRRVAGVAGGSEVILLVEDEDLVRRAAGRILAGAGYTVHPASNGAEALELLESLEGSVDLVLSDVVMPGMTTLEFMDRLRDRLPTVPVVFMSGYTDEVIVRYGLTQAGVRFLEKPFAVETLLESVRNALDARETS